MQTLTAILPARPTLPEDLALLLTPVRANEPSAPGEYVGHAEGVVLDDDGRVVAFVLRLARKLDERGARTVVPVAALTLDAGPMLNLEWTEAELCARPRLIDNPAEHPVRAAEIADAAPGDVQAPPSVGVAALVSEAIHAHEVSGRGIAGGVVGVAVGALAGATLGAPIAASLAAFFAVGGALLGMTSGTAAVSTMARATTHLAPLASRETGPLSQSILRLEERLRAPGLEDEGLVSASRFTPAKTDTVCDPLPVRAAQI